MELCSGAKVTPLLARPADPLLLPLTDVFLMIPEQKQHLCHSASTNVAAAALLCGPPTCRRQHVQPLQAVSSGRLVSCLREAALALVQHGSRRDDARGRGFPHPQVQSFNLSFLVDLQVLHLHQVSTRRKMLELNSCTLID